MRKDVVEMGKRLGVQWHNGFVNAFTNISVLEYERIMSWNINLPQDWHIFQDTDNFSNASSSCREGLARSVIVGRDLGGRILFFLVDPKSNVMKEGLFELLNLQGDYDCVIVDADEIEEVLLQNDDEAEFDDDEFE